MAASQLYMRPQPDFQSLSVLFYHAFMERAQPILRPLALVRQTVSHGFTALLLGLSIFGTVQLVQIGHEIAVPAATAGSTQTLRQSAVTTKSKAASDVRASPAATASSKTTSGGKSSSPAAYGAATPTRLQIPSIQVDAPIVSVGLDDNGALQVPAKDTVGWYTGSPTPGQIGPAIIDGHVDSVTGIAVFWYLRNLAAGDSMTISRSDGTELTFRVERIASYDQHTFPTKEVYGNTNYPGLRLITCDGTFDYATRHYSNNLVVYARLVQ